MIKISNLYLGLLSATAIVATGSFSAYSADLTSLITVNSTAGTVGFDKPYYC